MRALADEPSLRHLGVSLSRVEWLRPTAIFVAGIGMGIAVVTSPLGAVALTAALVTFAVAIHNPGGCERALTLTLVGGAMVLGYGFGNLGIRLGSFPLPATEILFLPLAAVALANGRTRLGLRVLLPLTLFGMLVGARLLIDYPKYGAFSIRDATLAIEAFILLVGHRAVARDGLELWLGRLTIVFLFVFGYGLLHPWQERIEQLGPTVGLQHPVSLLDMTGVKPSVVAVSLFFAVFAKGWSRLIILSLTVGLLGVFQARTLYVLFPLSLLVLGWARRQVGRSILQLVPVIATGVLLLMFANSLSLQGRRGPVDLNFLQSNAATLLGREGPGAGTIVHRGYWFSRTMEEVNQSSATVLFGVGLGPDLTFGFLGPEGQAVRKPHNDYLEVYARTGIVGLMIFLWLLLACLVPIARKARSGDGRDERFCAWILAASIVYLGVAGAQPALAFPAGTVPLFFILGMGLAVCRTGESRQSMRAYNSPTKPVAR